MASYHTTDDSSSLTKAEREVVLTIADDESVWHIFTDSQRLSGRLRKLAAAWGVTPERLGHGWACSLPFQAISFRAPKAKRELAPEEREAIRARLLESKTRRNGIAISEGNRTPASGGDV